MGKRFTGIEREQIEKFVSDGLTNSEIAERLGRTEAAVRNLRYRENLRTETSKQLPSLVKEKNRLDAQISQLTNRSLTLSVQVQTMQRKSDQISSVLKIGEAQLTERIQKTLVAIKQKKPDLFTMTGQEQLNRLTVELASSFLRWLTA